MTSSRHTQSTRSARGAGSSRAGGNPVASNPESLITEHIDLWTSTIKARKTQGRGSSKKRELYGVKKLRELILELAVRGKLVPQDPSDEPAGELLNRISAEKEQLIKDKKIKSPKALPVIEDKEKTFDLPIGWEWTRLGDTVAIIRGITFPASEKCREPALGRVGCLRTTNVQHITEWDDLLYVNEKFVKRADQYVMKNDILMSMANSRELVGKVSFVEEVHAKPCSFGGFLSVLRPYNVEPLYIMSVLRSPDVKAAMIGSASQTTNIANVSLEKLNPLVIAIPPLGEQHRIVEKVDELMALCDELEQQTESSLDAHNLLVDTLLSTLTDAHDANELSDNWARLADHFDTLITTDYAVEQLKQTILQLAVQGKLVPQDPRDEPVSILLGLAKKAKSELGATRKIRKDKETYSAENFFDVPNSWVLTTIGEFAHVLGGKRVPRGYSLLDTPTDHVYIRVTDMKNNSILQDNLKYIDENIFDQISQYIINKEDVYVSIAGTIGAVGVVPENLDGMNLTENASKLVFQCINRDFLVLAVQSNYVQRQFASAVNQMAQPKLSLNSIKHTSIACPPLEEQHRIVTKVDELMLLCDQLKEHLNDAKTIQLHLADAVVDNALAV